MRARSIPGRFGAREQQGFMNDNTRGNNGDAKLDALRKREAELREAINKEKICQQKAKPECWRANS